MRLFELVGRKKLPRYIPEELNICSVGYEGSALFHMPLNQSLNNAILKHVSFITKNHFHGRFGGDVMGKDATSLYAPFLDCHFVDNKCVLLCKSKLCVCVCSLFMPRFYCFMSLCGMTGCLLALKLN